MVATCRNQQFAAGGLRRIGRDWRVYDLDIDTVGTPGESRVPVEFLHVILLRGWFLPRVLALSSVQ
jgi:hypothetical protein